MTESTTPPDAGGSDDPLEPARATTERELIEAPELPYGSGGSSAGGGSGGLPEGGGSGGAPPAPMGAGPNSDERLVAAISHILAFLAWFWIPLLLNGIIFLGWKDRSHYVAFQSAQAFVYNIALACASWLLFGMVLGHLLLICLLPFVIALVVCGYLYALWGAFQTANGKDFSYLIVGPLVADYLDRHPM